MGRYGNDIATRRELTCNFRLRRREVEQSLYRFYRWDPLAVYRRHDQKCCRVIKDVAGSPFDRDDVHNRRRKTFMRR